MKVMVYKHPGNEKKPDNIKFKGEIIDYKVVDIEDIDSALESGWARTPEDSLNKKKKPGPKPKSLTEE